MFASQFVHTGVDGVGLLPYDNATDRGHVNDLVL